MAVIESNPRPPQLGTRVPSASGTERTVVGFVRPGFPSAARPRGQAPGSQLRGCGEQALPPRGDSDGQRGSCPGAGPSRSCRHCGHRQRPSLRGHAPGTQAGPSEGACEGNQVIVQPTTGRAGPSLPGRACGGVSPEAPCLRALRMRRSQLVKGTCRPVSWPRAEGWRERGPARLLAWPGEGGEAQEARGRRAGPRKLAGDRTPAPVRGRQRLLAPGRSRGQSLDRRAEDGIKPVWPVR